MVLLLANILNHEYSAMQVLMIVDCSFLYKMGKKKYERKLAKQRKTEADDNKRPRNIVVWELNTYNMKEVCLLNWNMLKRVGKGTSTGEWYSFTLQVSSFNPTVIPFPITKNSLVLV